MGAARAETQGELDAKRSLDAIATPEGCRALATWLHDGCRVRHLFACGEDPSARVEYEYQDGELIVVQHYDAGLGLDRVLYFGAADEAAVLRAPPAASPHQIRHHLFSGARLAGDGPVVAHLARAAALGRAAAPFHRVYWVETAVGVGARLGGGHFLAEVYRERAPSVVTLSGHKLHVRRFDYEMVEIFGYDFFNPTRSRSVLIYAPRFGGYVGHTDVVGAGADHWPRGLILPGEPEFLARRPSEICR